MSGSEILDEGTKLSPTNIDRREDTPAGMSLIVFFFGLGAGLLAAFFWADIVGESLSTVFSIFVIAMLVLGGIVSLVLYYRKRLITYLFDVTQTHLSSFAEPLEDVTRYAMKKDAEGATTAARRLVQLSLARYAWIATRRWIVASLTALIAAMAALGGTTLLYRQNQLLAAQSVLLKGQNQRLDEQNRMINMDINLAEAARNAELVVEISRIGGELATVVNKISREEQPADLDKGASTVAVIPQPARDIEPGLVARIVATSMAVRPYRFLSRKADPRDYGERLRTAIERRTDLPLTLKKMGQQFGWQERQKITNLISRPASPERGQLLAVMLKAGIRQTEWFSFHGLDLSYAKVEADLISLASFHQARLAFADFSYTIIGGSNFGGAILDNAWFKKSIIFDTSFAAVAGDKIPEPYKKSEDPAATRLAGADFSNSALIKTRFDGASMTAARFDDAVLSDVSFANAIIATSTFYNTVLINPDFSGTQLQSVDFDETIVFDKDFIMTLGKIAHPGTFKPARFKVEPIPIDEVYKNAAAFAQIGVRIDAKKVEDKQAYRIKRVAPFEK
jgi:hypothetical protein